MAVYSIKEISDMFQINASTLRYYEEIGLLSQVGRTESGKRIYTEEHVNRLKTIFCFKGTGMSISKLKAFFSYEENEEKYIDDILNLLMGQEESVKVQLLQLQKDLEHVMKKVKYYTDIKKAIDSGDDLPSWEDYEGQ